MRKYSGPIDRKKYAMSSETSQDELDYLSQSDICFVREEVAKNSNTSVDTLFSMVPQNLKTQDDFRIVTALLMNPSVTQEIINLICEKTENSIDEVNPRDFYEPQLIEGLFNHSKPDIQSLVSILNNPKCPKYLRGKVAGISQRLDVLEFLSNDVSEKIRKRAVRQICKIS